MEIFIASSDPTAWETVWNFFKDGGWFMLPILACSMIAVSVVTYKLMTLSKSLIIPSALTEEVEEIEEHLKNENIEGLQKEFQAGETSLARLCQVAFHNAGRTQGEVQQAVQSAAREEIVKMNTGMPLSLIHISEPTRPRLISYAVFCLK